MIFRLVLQKEQTAEQYDGEDHGAEDSVLQVTAENRGHESCDGGTGGTAEVTRKGKQGKHGRAAEFDAFRGKRECTRPEDTDGKAADDTADERDDGIGGKTNDQITDDAEERASHRRVFHGYFFAEFCVKDTGDTHRDGKAARTEQVSRRLIDRKCAFRKGGSPLCNGELGSARANHHDQHKPENLLGKELFVIGCIIFFLSDRIEGNEGKEKDVEKGNQREQTGEQTPMLNTDEYEERRAEQNGCHDSPAIEGVKKAHNARLVFRGTGFHDGADQNLEKTATDRIDHRGDQKSREAVDHIGKKRHADESDYATGVREQNRFAIADLLHVPRGKQVRQKLRDEIDGDQKRDSAERNIVRFAERKKKKGC